jgi:hypothetical protein
MTNKTLPDIKHTPLPDAPANESLNALVGEEPVDLISLIVDEEGNRRTRYPENAVKNRAAYATLLSGDPQNFSQIYQSIVAEHQEGADYTRKAIMDRIMPGLDTEAKHGVMQILADPRFSDEQKRAAIASLNDGFIREPATILANSAYAASVNGESPEAESVRISGAEQFRGVQEYKQYIQGIRNRHEAMRDQDGQAAFFVEFLETMLPFATNKNSASNIKQLSDELKLGYGTGKAFTLPGSLAKDISDTLNSMPAQDRIKVVEKLYQIVENNKGIFFTNDNKFAELEQIQKVLSGEYSTFDKVLDNGVAVLDLFGLGLPGMIKGGVKRLTRLVTRTPEKVEQKVAQRGVVDTTSPVAPLNVVKEANPEQAAGMLSAIAKSEGDEVAQALAGTSRADALAAEMLPQPKVVDGTVEAKLVDPDEALKRIEGQIDPVLKNAVDDAGGLEYTMQERKAVAENVLNKLDSLAGLKVLDNMASVGLDGDKVVITGMFGNAEGGFLKAEEAFNQAKHALAEYSITENDIKLFKKIDGEYVPISLDEARMADGIPFGMGKPLPFSAKGGKGTVLFEQLEDGRLKRTVTYEDGEKKVETLVTTKDGDEVWVSTEQYQKGEYYPKAFSKEEVEAAAKEHVPGELHSGGGNYTVGVDFDYKFTTKDVPEWESLDVKRNFFDRIPALRTSKSGTAANHLLDAASMLHPTITGSASVAVDRAVRIDKLFLEMHNKFSDEFVKLPKARQDKLYEHLKEANALGLELDDVTLVGRGFAPDEISLIKDWRKAWDTHFFYENQDVVRSLRNQGYQVFEDNAKGTKFFTKPVQKNGNIDKVYDAATDSVRSVSRYEMDHLYNHGGYYAQFRRPITVNGVEVEHMIVRNTPTEYLRALNDTDQVLNYRKGYFQVGYKAPFFIEEIVKTSGGNEKYRRVVSMAGSTEEANHIRDRLATRSGLAKEDFNIRGDIKELKPDTDWYWDLQHAGGRVAQRHRGKLLETTAQPSLNAFDPKYILDPVESAIRASRSLSSRIAMRDVLDTHKARAVEQYGEFFPRNKNTGQIEWPENSNSLVAPGKMTDKRIADARTTVEYINFLQHGYDNAVDDFFKGAFNTMAEMLAKIGATKLEKGALWAAKGKPVEHLKHGVFQAYIATNPLRQLLVQSHQSIRMLGYNPSYVLSGQAVLDGGTYFRYASGMADIKTASKEAQELVEFVQASGMLQAVDKHNLVRGSLSQLAESSSQVKRAAGALISAPRRAGFDIGEQSNLLMHLLSVRDKYVKAGKDITDKFVRDEIYSTARALSYDMNRAGDMPYNSNWAALFMQFFQVPHKAITSVLTNRRIPGTVNPLDKKFYKISSNDKLRLAAMDIVLFGIPGGAAITNLVGEDMLPTDPKQREAVIFGVTSIAYNELFSQLAGEDILIDFSSLSPYGTDGFARFFEAVLSGGLEEFFMNSPAATLYFKEHSRVREAFSRMFRYFGFEKMESGQDPEDLLSVLKGVGEVSSGVSNASKAYLMWKMGKLQDKQGNVLADNTNFMYAVAQALGLPPMEVKLVYDAQKKGLAAGSAAHRDEVDKWYKDYIRVITRDQKLSNQDPEFAVKVVQAMMERWRDDPVAMNQIKTNLMRDMRGREGKLYKDMFDYSNYPDTGDTDAFVNNLGILNDKEKNNALQIMRDAKEHFKKVNGK